MKSKTDKSTKNTKNTKNTFSEIHIDGILNDLTTSDKHKTFVRTGLRTLIGLPIILSDYGVIDVTVHDGTISVFNDGDVMVDDFLAKKYQLPLLIGYSLVSYPDRSVSWDPCTSEHFHLNLAKKRHASSQTIHGANYASLCDGIFYVR